MRETFPEMVIIGNGDAHSFTEANQMISKTSVDAAMSGYVKHRGELTTNNSFSFLSLLFAYITGTERC